MANWIAEGVASEVNDYSTSYIAKFLGKIIQGGPAMMSHQVALRKPPYGG